MLTNFLEETIEILKENGKTEDDVLWVGNKNRKTTWNNFKKLANFEYYQSFGAYEIKLDFMIVGNGWWLERREYDGAEGWMFQSPPIEPIDNSLSCREDFLEDPEDDHCSVRAVQTPSVQTPTVQASVFLDRATGGIDIEPDTDVDVEIK